MKTTLVLGVIVALALSACGTTLTKPEGVNRKTASIEAQVIQKQIPITLESSQCGDGFGVRSNLQLQCEISIESLKLPVGGRIIGVIYANEGLPKITVQTYDSSNSGRIGLGFKHELFPFKPRQMNQREFDGVMSEAKKNIENAIAGGLQLNLIYQGSTF